MNFSDPHIFDNSADICYICPVSIMQWEGKRADRSALKSITSWMTSHEGQCVFHRHVGCLLNSVFMNVFSKRQSYNLADTIRQLFKCESILKDMDKCVTQIQLAFMIQPHQNKAQKYMCLYRELVWIIFKLTRYMLIFCVTSRWIHTLKNKC